MNINLPTEDFLKDLGPGWPLKDAKSVWQSLYELSVKDFLDLVPLLEYPGTMYKVGRPTRLEKLARQVLFEMSTGQRRVAYDIIQKKAIGVSRYLEVKNNNLRKNNYEAS